MALILADRVRETSTTTGTGALTLAGAVVGYQTFSSAIGNTNTTYYAISNPGVAEFEVGIGTYATSGNTLTRTTILKSSNSNNAVNFSAGTKDVFVTYPATKSVYLDASNNVGIGTSVNSVYDGVAQPRPLVVQSASATTVQYDSTNAIVICNSDTTTNNASQLNFAAITGASTNQYTSAVISCIYGTRTNTSYPAGILTFATSTVTQAPVERMRITSAGDVGIGTTAPNVNLEVYNATSVAQRLTAGSNIFEFINNSTENRISAIAALPLTFRTSNTEYMRIDSSGNVEIGITTAAPAKFTVSGQGGSNVWVQNNINTGTGAIVSLAFSNANGLVGYVQTSGSATSYVTSSDYRLKDNVTPMTEALAKILELKPVTYKWKVDGSDGQGFIAHELQAVVPDCVTGEKDATREEEYEVSPSVPAVVDAEGIETTPAVEAVKGTRTVPSYQGVDTSFLVATLTAAIQELKAIIDTQATRIAALEAK